MCCVIFLLPLVGVVYANVLQSKSNTIASICENVNTSIQLLNKNEVLRLVDGEKCKNYELLGDAVLKVVNKEQMYCYSDIAKILCNVRFIPYEANSNCEYIKNKFMTILKTCFDNESTAVERQCSNVNKEEMTVDDPVEFCKSNFVTLKDAKTSTSFTNVEFDYCSRMVDSFNFCQLLAKKLNYQRFCLDGGFQSYCSHYVQEVHDNSYSIICKNFVLPFILGNLLESANTPTWDLCKNVGVGIENALLSKRDNLMTMGQRNMDVLDSELAYKTWSQEGTARITKMIGLLEMTLRYVHMCHRNLFNIFGTPLNFDSLIKSEWYKSLGLVKKLYESCEHFPTDYKDIPSLIKDFDKVSSVEAKLQEAVINFKQLYSLHGSKFPLNVSSIHQSGLFRPIPKDILDQTMSYCNEIQKKLPQRISRILALLSNETTTPGNLDTVKKYHDSANNLKFIASLHEAQLSALRKQLVKSKETNFMQAIKSM
ncbi:hypothetical protein BdWA1_003391 [Babesia duncani]|uniref:DUF19 domain-containing protein n=1 Tax=Babesia duncani TaxID=323732 RepID=A0AAD9PHQ7_9APIC|nr:hypothetical protein BdWA1_003391 [Babesia duncani]